MKEGNNRIILATDGDFNVGIYDIKELVSYIEEKRKSGVY
jgi:Ca-activated chloride channel family protein